MRFTTSTLIPVCIAAILTGTAGVLPTSAQETNELGLTAEQAEALNAAIDEGRTYFRQRKYRDAVSAYRRALVVYDGDPTTFYNLGLSYQGLDNGDSAVAMLRRSIEIAPGFGPARLAVAREYLTRGELMDAEHEYDAIIADIPDSTQYVLAARQGLHNVALQFTNKAVREIRQRNYDVAEQHAAHAAHLAPNVYRPQYISAMVQERKRNTGAAKAFFEAALDLAIQDGERAAALNGIGRTEANQAKAAQRSGNNGQARRLRQQAVDHLKQATELDPSLFPAFVTLGNTLYELGRYAEARTSLERAEELDRRNPKVPFKLAETYMQLGQCTKAEAAASRAIARQPTNASAHAVRAEALECLGRKRDAIDEYVKAARDPRWRQRAQFKANELREDLGLPTE